MIDAPAKTKLSECVDVCEDFAFSILLFPQEVRRFPRSTASALPGDLTRMFSLFSVVGG